MFHKLVPKKLVFTKYFIFILINLLIILPFTEAFFDLVSVGVGVGSWAYGVLKSHTYCRMTECCTKDFIPGNVDKLEVQLRTNLYGQHIVADNLLPALKAHFGEKIKMSKPLVMSFHGTPGTGKNFVANMIAESMYKEGMRSKFVHKYSGRIDFPRESEIEFYRKRIYSEVSEALKTCPNSLFIFDEVEKIPQGLLEYLNGLVDHFPASGIYDHGAAIVIFLSNTAGDQIADQLGQLIKGGTLREETKLSDFEHMLKMTAYNVDGGMQNSALIANHIIDHYIPFLPLEKEHVVKCIKREYIRWSVYSPQKERMEKILEDIRYDSTHGLFATSGCKTLERKVAGDIMAKRN